MPTDKHRAWIKDALGVKGTGASSAKGTSGAKSAARGKKVTTIEMEEEVIEVAVATGLPGDTGEQMIKDQLSKMQTCIGDYWDNYMAGIQKFTNKMSFASEEEAEAKHLQATFTAIAKKALDYALGEAGKKLGGPWGEILGAAKDVAEAWVAETERAAAAAGEVKVVKYVNGLIDGISKQRDGMRTAVENGKRPLIEEYLRLAKSDNLKGKATADGRIIGDAAKIVKEVQAGVEAFHKALPTAAYFQQQFTRAFADTPGMTDLVSHGGREAGKLYFEIHVYLEVIDGVENWSIESDGTSSAWKLVTLQEHPDRVAESLLESLGGGKPWQIDLPKKVKLTVEVEEFGLNSYKECWLFFSKNPDQVEFGAFTDPKFAMKVWKLPRIRSKALDNMKLVGSSE